MIELGRLCVKIAGRDAGKIGIVIDVLDEKNVMLDGQTRRRKCNIGHIELMDKIIQIEKNAENSSVVAALKEAGVICEEKKESKSTKTPDRPKKVKIVKKAPIDATSAEKKKDAKKAEKKAKPSKEKKSD